MSNATVRVAGETPDPLPERPAGGTRRSEVSRLELTMQALDDIGLGDLLKLPAFAELDRASIEAALSEYIRFMDDVVAPTDRVGDRAGNVHDPETGAVATPPGFKEAYQSFVQAGWGAVPFPAEEGGGGFPRLVGTAMQEIFASANMGLSLCPSLTQSAIELLTRWGSESQRSLYLPKLLTGEWNGTMQITESDSGSDVGAIRATAVPRGDGTWELHGTKIFISWGEHDMAENIVHMVLARTPDSPAGTRGLSLFVVPKFLVDADGGPGERNGVKCLSIEHKMGLHASPTCVMELDGAIGELVGLERGGMRAMFTMMNPARLSIGLQGLSVGEVAYTESRELAAERRQGSLTPGGAPVAIDEHADVRRMLSLMRSNLDAMRLVIYRTALHTDLAAAADTEEERTRAQEMVELLTPVAKAWTTDLGVEVASLGIQVHGGMGFIEETRAPQRFRDSRIGPIYEGTNGIQAIDLVTRKLRLRDGGVVADLLEEMEDVVSMMLERGGEYARIAGLHASAISAVRDAADWLNAKLGAADADGREDALAGATGFLSAFGDLVGGWLLGRRALERDSAEALAVAGFYAIERMTTIPGRCVSVTSGARRLFV